MVNEYETNPVASDSEDEKRIYKAEARASRKAKSERGLRRGRWRGGYLYSRRGFGYRRMTEAAATTSQTQNQPTKRQGNCFICHGEGHWKFECPSAKAANSSNNKISSYSFPSACQSNILIHDQSSEESKKSPDEEVKVSPVGRLNQELNKWKEITDDSYILDVIEHGYQLPLKDNPPGTVLRNNRSARDNMFFVKEEVKNLVSRGVVSQVHEAPKVVNPLTVAYNKKGKPRLVLDCRHVNQYLHTFKFKYEDIKIAEEMFEKGSFLFTYDLKSAYHSIDINLKHRSLLGFAVHDGGKTKWYVFNSLPFGIASAGHIFTKVLRVVVAFWRAKGHKIIMFLDDGIGGAKTLDEAVRSSNFARETLLTLGFLLAEEKCQWEPTRQAVWLGYYIDMHEARLYITEERIKRLEIFIDSVLSQIEKDQYSLIHVKVLASVVGQIISLQHVIGKKVRLLTRQMYKCILSRASWNAPVFVSEAAKSELLFWKTNARGLNDKGKSLYGKTFYELGVYADASSTGYGGFIEPYGHILTSSSMKAFGKFQKEYELEARVDTTLTKCTQNPPDAGSESSEMSLERTPEVGFEMPPEVGFDRPPEVGVETIPEMGCGSKPEAIKVKNQNHDKFVFNSYTENDEKSIERHGAEPLKNMSEVCKGDIQTPTGTQHVSGIVFGDWSREEKLKSSTWRESETVRRVLKSNIKDLKNKKIKVFSDNKNVQSVLQIGSRISELQEIACDINELCETNGITLCPEWIPRADNQMADDLSRFGDCDDWSVSDSVFHDLDAKWGLHTFDRFASNYKTKCCNFKDRRCVYINIPPQSN